MRVAYLSPLRNSASLVPPLVSAQYNGRVGVKQDGARGRKVFGVKCVTLSLPRRGCLIMLNRRGHASKACRWHYSFANHCKRAVHSAMIEVIA